MPRRRQELTGRNVGARQNAEHGNDGLQDTGNEETDRSTEERRTDELLREMFQMIENEKKGQKEKEIEKIERELQEKERKRREEKEIEKEERQSEMQMMEARILSSEHRKKF